MQAAVFGWRAGARRRRVIPNNVRKLLRRRRFIYPSLASWGGAAGFGLDVALGFFKRFGRPLKGRSRTGGIPNRRFALSPSEGEGFSLPLASFIGRVRHGCRIFHVAFSGRIMRLACRIFGGRADPEGIHLAATATALNDKAAALGQQREQPLHGSGGDAPMRAAKAAWCRLVVWVLRSISW